MLTKSFTGHDNLDEEANNPNDIDVDPTSLRRYEHNHCFTIMQLRLPSTLKMEDAPTILWDDIAPEWLIVPDHLEQFIDDISGVKYKCGYRISKTLNFQKWNMESWPLELRPQEGDWLLSGPHDKSESKTEEYIHSFGPMDEIALGKIFLEGNISGEIFYVARSMQHILTDIFFFENMLEKGPVIFTKYVDGVSLFGKKMQDLQKNRIIRDPLVLKRKKLKTKNDDSSKSAAIETKKPKQTH
jgi:hypothetical protein